MSHVLHRHCVKKHLRESRLWHTAPGAPSGAPSETHQSARGPGNGRQSTLQGKHGAGCSAQCTPQPPATVRPDTRPAAAAPPPSELHGGVPDGCSAEGIAPPPRRSCAALGGPGLLLGRVQAHRRADERQHPLLQRNGAAGVATAPHHKRTPSERAVRRGPFKRHGPGRVRPHAWAAACARGGNTTRGGRGGNTTD
ncbi:MAG: hypothetical protein J3K34DRAFT_412489 [Monoraphidium minutum]|nr:MAG: hypothetical protein J3K34DRAFT_412489 [Monoraphidium minutum]